MSRLSASAAALLLGISASAAFAAEPYDLLIRNGLIADGTGNPAFRGDVAVRGGRVVAVGRVPAAPAKREIDATGLVVAPGFIDIHSHSEWLLLEDGDAQSKIRQGVTTEVFGENDSPGPSLRKIAPKAVTIAGKRVEIATLGDYFDAVERATISVNVCSYVGSSSVRRCVMGDSFDKPSPAQLQEMQYLVRDAMRDGAFGLSSMLAMPPGSLFTEDELVELCKVVREFGGIYSTHTRNEGTGVFEAVKEAISIGERAGVPVDIIHLKIADEKLWGKMDGIVAMIEAARKRGVNVQANAYPYTRGSNNLASIVPPWAHEGGREAMLARLKDIKLRERMKRDIREGLPGWYNHYTAVGGDWSRMLIADRNDFSGQTMDKVLAARAKGKTPAPDPLDEFFDFLLEQNGSVATVYAHHTEKDMQLALGQPWCSVGSDGLAYADSGPLRRGHPHPRSFGTFPRVLADLVRDRGVLRLEDAVRKMTSLNAAKLGIRDRGLLREGQWADITLFDPEAVKDFATYEQPFQYPAGIPYVIVNGTLVIDAGKHTGARPGKAIRHRPPASLSPGPNPKTIAVGHRGLMGYAPENTLAGFRVCLQLGCGFELDPRRTKDGKLVVMHDPTVDRTTDGRGKVAGFTLEEIRKLDAGSKAGPAFRGERVPTMEEVFDLLAKSGRPDSLVAVDLKEGDPEMESDLVRMAVEHTVLDRLIFIGRAIDRPEVRAKLRKVHPLVHIGVLAATRADFAAALTDNSGDWAYVRFLPRYDEVVDAQKAGKRVFIAGPLTAGLNREEWSAAAAAGVHGILTDYPLELARHLRPAPANVAAAGSDRAGPVAPTETIRLFNGKDLTGFSTWLADTKREDPRGVFTVADGMIHASGDGMGYVATDKEYRDYRLTLEFKWGKRTDGGKYVRNSGILLHATGPDGGAGKNAWMSCIECQLAQGCVGDLIVIRGKDEAGAVIPVAVTAETELAPDGKRRRWKKGGESKTFPPARGQLWWGNHDWDFKEFLDTRGKDDVESPVGEWTKMEVIADGKTLTISVNGTVVNHCTEVFPAAGKILLQCEGFEVYFRKVELHPLKK